MAVADATAHLSPFSSVLRSKVGCDILSLRICDTRKVVATMQTSGRKLHSYPFWSGLLIFGGISVVLQVLIILDCFFPLIAYETDAVSTVMSTCATTTSRASSP